MERLRVAVSIFWLFAAIYIATDLRVSWVTGPIFLMLGIIPPVALFILWSHPMPAMGRRSKDPRL